MIAEWEGMMRLAGKMGNSTDYAFYKSRIRTVFTNIGIPIPKELDSSFEPPRYGWSE
jgi:hypothetical protein